MSDRGEVVEEGATGRRGFLAVLGGLTVAWLAAVAWPVFRYLSPRPPPDPFGGEGKALVKGVAPGDVARPGQGSNGSYGGRGLVVFRGPDGQLRAFDSKCTHAGCNVQFQGDRIYCNCHGGTYDLEGRNIAGPPPRPLTPLRVTAEGDSLFVSPMSS
ncbi:MAG TPA: Rieske 2Fe-2S domain-containing protein [Myxococcota bacterium]|nr:Rieske 2Fe-2S domain-containing protein [Myxococcota bacterium]HQK51356.1 Rieske 2Fe-2S domain-containing protein [Myxococcota bacterium]